MDNLSKAQYADAQQRELAGKYSGGSLYDMALNEEQINRELEIMDMAERGEITKDQVKELIAKTRDKYTPTVTEKKEPGIDVVSRALYKNFGTQDDTGLAALTKANPGKEFRRWRGQVLAREKGAKDWNRLDEPGFSTVGEFAQDVGDIAYDIPAAIASQAATTAGGIYGGLATAPLGGVGALPAASAAGAASTAGIEALRQKIGESLGYGQMDPEQIKYAGMIGAASPLMFGTGATGSNILRAGGKDLTAQELKALVASQSGIPMRAGKYTSEKFGSILSGQTRETVQHAKENLPRILASGPEDYARIVDDLGQNIVQKWKDYKNGVKGKYVQVANDMGLALDAETAEKPLRDLVQKYEANFLKDVEKFGDDALNKVSHEDYQYVKEIYDKYSQGGVLDPERALEYRDKIKDLSGIRKNADLGKMSAVDGDVLSAAEQVRQNVEHQLETVPGGMGDQFKAAKDTYKQMKKEEQIFEKYFETPDRVETFLNAVGGQRSKQYTKDEGVKLAQNLGIDVMTPAKDVRAIRTFAEPSEELLSLGSSTTGRTLRPAALAGIALGSQIENKGGAMMGAGIGSTIASYLGSPAWLRRFMQGGRMYRDYVREPLVNASYGGFNPYQAALTAGRGVMLEKQGE